MEPTTAQDRAQGLRLHPGGIFYVIEGAHLTRMYPMLEARIRRLCNNPKGHVEWWLGGRASHIATPVV